MATTPMKAAGSAAMLLAALAASPAQAQEQGSRRTREFVQAAGESDAFEIAEAHTAIAQSTDPRLIAFARQMLRDHGRTGASLRRATARAGIAPPPTGLGEGQAPFLAALQSLRGREFDTAYWRQQALAHRSALTSAQGYATDGDAPAIRSAAAATLPMIRAHLAMAERMSAKAGS